MHSFGLNGQKIPLGSLNMFSRLLISKVTFGLFVAAQMLGWVTIARASEIESKPGAGIPPQPPEAARQALREFDRFLDHHPMLEDELRLDPRRVSDPGYLQKNPRLEEFMRANPEVTVGLGSYPRYFLNRALLRQASAPVTFTELAPLKEIFLREPALELELNKNPAAIRDPGFLQSHPDLSDVLSRNPALARVFLPPAVSPKHR
jgi:hypothetical protein